MSHEIKYDRYFRIVTVSGDDTDVAGVGIEEYSPSDGSILYIASIYAEGGRTNAVHTAMRTIAQEVTEDERVIVRLNGRNWRVWAGLYPRFKITNVKRGRAGWCGMLAGDALARKQSIYERI